MGSPSLLQASTSCRMLMFLPGDRIFVRASSSALVTAVATLVKDSSLLPTTLLSTTSTTFCATSSATFLDTSFSLRASRIGLTSDSSSTAWPLTLIFLLRVFIMPPSQPVSAAAATAPPSSLSSSSMRLLPVALSTGAAGPPRPASPPSVKSSCCSVSGSPRRPHFLLPFCLGAEEPEPEGFLVAAADADEALPALFFRNALSFPVSNPFFTSGDSASAWSPLPTLRPSRASSTASRGVLLLVRDHLLQAEASRAVPSL